MVPHSSLALDTVRIPEGAGVQVFRCASVQCWIPEDTATGVSVHALPAVTDPGLAEVTDGAHHHHPRGVGSCRTGQHNDFASCRDKQPAFNCPGSLHFDEGMLPTCLTMQSPWDMHFCLPHSAHTGSLWT